MQQVNLYTDAFKPKRVILPLEQIIILPVFILVLLVALSFWLSHSLQQESQELGDLQAKNDQMGERLQGLNVKANRLKKDESLVAANQRLHAKVEARQQMIDMLDTVVVKDAEGFSAIMLSLARQKLDRLWLSSIYIGASGKDMHIEGSTLDGDLVPEYLRKLRQEDSLLGRTFTLFELTQNTNEHSQLDFSLRTEQQSSTVPELLLSRQESGSEVLASTRDAITAPFSDKEVQQ